MTEMSRPLYASLGLLAPHGLNTATVMVGDLDALIREEEAAVPWEGALL